MTFVLFVVLMIFRYGDNITYVLLSLLPTDTDCNYISPTQIGETIADKITGKPLPSIKVEEPTVRMSFSINTSPFVGREVYD